MGIDRVDNILMVLGISLQMTESERHIVTKEMIKGFNDCALEAETIVTGGQSVMNPWPIIGGTAITMCRDGEYRAVNQGQPGDKLLLTKPLGTQVAVNLKEWKGQGGKLWEQSQRYLSEQEVDEGFFMAVESMSHLNKNAAKLMRKYEAHGATDITGFGIKGHAQNLCSVQKENVDFLINSLPVI